MSAVWTHEGAATPESKPVHECYQQECSRILRAQTSLQSPAVYVDVRSSLSNALLKGAKLTNMAADILIKGPPMYLHSNVGSICSSQDGSTAARLRSACGPERHRDATPRAAHTHPPAIDVKSRACERPTSLDRAHVSPAAPEESAALSDTEACHGLTAAAAVPPDSYRRLHAPGPAHTLFGRPPKTRRARAPQLRHAATTPRARAGAAAATPPSYGASQGRPPRRRCAVLVLVSARVLSWPSDDGL
ncbi:hypothetical protein HPB50_004611 [Hyalomma asiaticum]|uniref:Uncharacterized protein n=1 Tax=Hyalomma asiaticum TaxID=266040 RepID=A0ACB7TF09_HYAAI|nr:hypothetical protein HPB50_004611 [Hyalomma asiaticum]